MANISMGGLDRPLEARMTRHICADSQLSWYRVCGGLPKLVAGDADRLTALLRRQVLPKA